MFRRRGFTLVELLVAVAIIGILAAIAIPRFVNASLRARQVEAVTNVEGIHLAERGYEATFDEYVIQDSYVPAAGRPNPKPRPWEKGTNFDELGWAPDGDVRCEYDVHGFKNRLRIRARCDLDGDRNTNRYKLRDWSSGKNAGTVDIAWVEGPDIY